MHRRARRAGALALLSALVGCFHGGFMLHKACRNDAECVELRCIDGFCGGPPAGESSTGGDGTCGDGVQDPGEECDGMLADPAQRCVACAIRSCPFGNHLVDEAFCEEVAGDPQACLATCVPDTCGDGLVDGGEQCDDGNLDNTDACPLTCRLASCGDGLVYAGFELCDDGNQDNADACDQRCTLPSCGDGALQDGEACDDKNLDNTDACRNTCLAAVCGDGVVQLGGEECDDGNTDDADACLSTCKAARCGDAVIQDGVELCDDGNGNDADACDNMCVLKSCGDGVLQDPEQCDDGNLDDTDACLSDCITAGCGDGQVLAGVETCDFGEYYNAAIGCVDECARLTVVVDIAAGQAHNCARLDDGGLRCWGQNDGCQLGLGDNLPVGDDEVPGAVPAVDLGGHAALEVVAGASHTCARFDDQEVRCWGFNLFGQLGYGDFFPRACGPDTTPGLLPGVPIWNGATATKQIAAGFYHTCALGEDGSLRCWGLGNTGQLGYGNTEAVGVSQLPADVPPVDVGGPVEEVRAGAAYTCARLSDGTVRCWGDNASGQLGSGDFEKIGDDETPASRPPLALPEPAVALHVGQYHACATLSDASVWCWGRNLSGELGLGMWSWGEPTPVAVDLGEPAMQLLLTTSTTCALRADGRVMCWGTGTEGQLANGTGASFGAGQGETAAAAPAIAFDGDLEVDLIAGAGGHLCARTEYATIRCWGLNDAGQLGYGHTNSAGDDPGEIPLATDVRLFAP